MGKRCQNATRIRKNSGQNPKSLQLSYYFIGSERKSQWAGENFWGFFACGVSFTTINKTADPGGLQLAANRLRFDRVAVFMAVWRYACKTAWATEKNVEILGNYCILPNRSRFFRAVACFSGGNRSMNVPVYAYLPLGDFLARVSVVRAERGIERH